jgi:hypothetical protein
VSNPEFQASVWVRGDHPRRYVQDYDEAVQDFCDFADSLLEDDFWTNTPLGAEQVKHIREFYVELTRYDDTLPRSVHDSQLILDDPRWPAIVSAAGDALASVLQSCGDIRPQI